VYHMHPKASSPSIKELAIQKNRTSKRMKSSKQGDYLLSVKRENIHKAMKNEGHAINKPPLFKGQNYDYWK
ncbi:hypothetical protein CR513_30359, partial [Mucuna pruriens]